MVRGWVGRGGASAIVAVVVIAVLATSCVVDGAWATMPGPTVPEDWNRMTQVDCPTAESCVAVGMLSDGENPHGFLATRDADDWDVLVTAAHREYTDITCSTPDRCLIPWTAHPPWTSMQTWGLDAWDGEDVIELRSGFDASAACVPGGPCRVFTFQQWFTWEGGDLVPRGSVPRMSLVSPSCPTTDMCLAVEEYDDVVHVIDDAGFHPIAAPADAAADLQYWDIACLSATNCQLVGDQLGPGEDMVTLLVAWDGATLTTKPNPAGDAPWQRWAISCATQIACVALSGTTTLAYNGGTWYVAPDAPTHANGALLGDVSCALGASVCFAVGGQGVADAAPAGSFAATYTWDDSSP